MGFDDENVFRVPKPDLMKLRSSLACCVLDRTDGAIVSISRSIRNVAASVSRVRGFDQHVVHGNTRASVSLGSLWLSVHSHNLLCVFAF